MKNSGSGPKNACSAMPRRLQEGLGAARDAARVTRVGLHGGRVEHVADQDDGRVGGERVDVGAGRIGQQHHVGLGDALPAGDRRTVEHHAVLEQAGLEDGGGIGDVVLDATHVGETQVDELDLVILDQLLDLFERHRVAPVRDGMTQS